VVDPDGKLVAICTRSTVVRAGGSPEAPLTDIADEDVVTGMASDTLYYSLHRMLEEGVEALPVVDENDHLVGICTRTDILRARRHQLELEEREPSSFRLPRRWRLKGRSE
jgi:CBS domain-containing protein